MRLRLILPILCAALAGAAAGGAARGDTITVKPDVHMLGEWVDGMAFDGKSLWIAEFGQSDMVQLNASYAVVRRIKLDGAPRSVDVGSDGAIYALDGDNNKVWQIAPATGQVKPLPGLKADVPCPTKLATGGGAFVWVLYTCSGENAVLLRIDPKSGAQTSVTLGSGGSDLLVRARQSVGEHRHA